MEEILISSIVLLMPDGSVRHVHIVAHVESDAADEVEFVGAVMDVTERKRAEEALERFARRRRISHTSTG